MKHKTIAIMLSVFNNLLFAFNFESEETNVYIPGRKRRRKIIAGTNSIIQNSHLDFSLMPEKKIKNEINASVPEIILLINPIILVLENFITLFCFKDNSFSGIVVCMLIK